MYEVHYNYMKALKIRREQ